MSRLTERQAEQVQRIRDALRVLGYDVPGGKPGSPGTLADLAGMAPAMGLFAARAGTDFARRMRAEKNPDKRAAFFLLAAEAAVRAARRTVPVGSVLNAIGRGFIAFRSTKDPKARTAAVLGTLDQITAAMSR